MKGLWVGLFGLAAGLLDADVVHWEFPRLRSCHEGVPFADGVTGVLVWGGGDELRLTVGRADLWDHRGGYAWTTDQSYTNIVTLWKGDGRDRLLSLFEKETPAGEPNNPYMLPFGRVVVKLPGRTLARGALDTETGLGAIELAEGGKIELAMSTDLHRFALRFPEGLAYEVKSVPATEFAVYERDLRPKGFEKAVTFDDAESGRGGFLWQLPVDESAWISWRSQGQEVCLATGRGGKSEPVNGSFDEVAAASVAQWKRFWMEGSRIKVPDPVIQRIYDYGMYRFGAMTDPSGVPAGLQGCWLEDDKLVPWNGDYHFNINVQECYSPAYRSGHLEHLRPLFAMIRSWWPRLHENARLFCGVDDGFVLPHSVDDHGVCIGGFWAGTIDHASTAWVATMMYRYATYAQDDWFLRDEAFPFMKGAMRVYEKMLEDTGERLALPLGPSPEWGSWDVRTAVGRNPSFQLAAIHRLARDLVAAAQRLGVEPDPLWLDISRRLPRYVR